MFEHLSPKVKKTAAEKRVKFKFYAWFLLMSLFVLVSTWGLSQGTASSAQDDPQITAAVYTTDSVVEEKVVADTPKLTVFNFTIKTNSPLVTLSQLKIQASGVYNEEWLADLKLYNNQTQLGQITNLGDGLLYLDLGSYPLKEGENNFSLRLNSTTGLTLAQAASFTIEQPRDIVLAYLDHPFSPEGAFPVSSQNISVIDKGQLLVYNNLVKTDLSLVASKQQLLGDFTLSTASETVSLQQVIIDYQTDNDLIDTKFSLSYLGNIVSQAIAEDGELIFNITEPLIVKTNQDLNLSFWGSLEQIGNYQFSLTKVIGSGFISGQQVELNNQLVLSKPLVFANVPYFEALDQAKLLSDGWNSLYHLTVSNPVDEPMTIDKLTWQLQNFGIQVEDLELWVDDNFYDNKLSLNNDLIVADFSSQPLIVDNTKDILLLVKTKSLTDQVRLQANLLSDTESSDNLLWSIDDQQYNGYQLPNFPLIPAVLSN